ncbi:MAG: toxin HigB [Bacteroidota bacterium]|nr:toxin HigB [Bacteroidota bacterium]
MNNLVWSESFIRSIKKYIRTNPDIQKNLDFTFELLAENIHHPLLHTHKLHGKLKGCYASSVEFDSESITFINK